ncbi:MAG: hypothetical protein HS126_30790 [Anaerolineales bacterium]|nr:hypothetical protein [Anaerolineales bacterium]
MSANNITQIAMLLSQAGSAHHHFEQTALKGVYDQEWPAWYADYAIQHSLGELLPTPVTVEQLGRFLAENYEVYQQENSKLGWADYTAQQIAAHWRNGS